ncbi:MAG: hypothetical protein H6582_01195 [Crocinitomicaceae bacterium]|nr:hypothetical protein [Crocinitomicaceae bacterium]
MQVFLKKIFYMTVKSIARSECFNDNCKDWEKYEFQLQSYQPNDPWPHTIKVTASSYLKMEDIDQD